MQDKTCPSGHVYILCQPKIIYFLHKYFFCYLYDASLVTENTKAEYLPLSGSTIVSKGSLPVSQTPVFQRTKYCLQIKV